jgi:hypothetical protein
VRVKLVHNLAQLSKRQETPYLYKMSRRRKSKDASQNIEPCEQCTPPYENTIILGIEAIWNPQDVDWDTKTLVDDESNADSMASMELEEHLMPPCYTVPFASRVMKKQAR